MVKGMREPYPDKASQWMAGGQGALFRILKPRADLIRTFISVSIEIRLPVIDWASNARPACSARNS